MKRFVHSVLAAMLTATALTACGSSSKQEAVPVKTGLPVTLEEALASQYRTPENMKRDQYRHPLETLTFFGIKPDMTVVEISPGGGWYMEILAPYLASKGTYIAALPAVSPEDTFATDMYTKATDWLKANPEVSTRSKISVFSPPKKLDIAPAGSADMVLTFRNVHNWMTKDGERAAFREFYRALKPGGTLGVVEHRADPKAPRDPKAKSGYVLEKDVIRLAEAAGFKLEARSEVNANPKDTKDHPEGVWTLPPTLKLKEKDQDKYLAIGESDRMTLKFVKPAKGSRKK